jgi:hypothetical protein
MIDGDDRPFGRGTLRRGATMGDREPGRATRATEEPASPRPPAEGVVVGGFAIGVGAVFVATLGVFWNYWQPGASPWLWGGGSFAIGAVLGAGWASLRRVRV